MVSLQRLDQLHKPDTFDDTLSAASIAGIEGAAVDYADFQEGILSQIKRILHGADAGNWHDDVTSVGASLANLAARPDPSTLLALFNRLNLTDVAVPASQNYVVLASANQPPNRPIAIAGTTKGAVSAQLATAVGVHALTELSGTNALKPKNLCQVFDGATGDPIISSSRRVYALLQVGSAATDGNSFTTTGNDQGQLSFVRPNATYDDLEACPVADIESKSIIYAFSNRDAISDHNEDEWRGDIDSADPSAGVTVSLDSAYDGGTFMEVDGNDVDIRLADTKSWVFRKGSGGVILFQITRNDAGTDAVTVEANVDQFESKAAANDFDQGVSIDSADQAINVGVTAAGQIDSSTLTLKSNTGDLALEGADDITFKTVRQTTALPLDDASAGAISALDGGPYASISAAIKAALATGANLALNVFVAASNYAQDVNVPAASLDLTAYSIDMNTPANVDAFVFLNGRLLYGGNGSTNNDVYAGDTPANGDLKFDFAKGIKAGDVIITLGLQ